MADTEYHHGPWSVGTKYDKFDLFSYGKLDYLVIQTHVSEIKHEPKPVSSKSSHFYSIHYRVYRGERTLGTQYEEKEAFKYQGKYFLVTENHTADEDNDPFTGKNRVAVEVE